MNDAYQQRNARGYFTVAELVARERATYAHYHRPRTQPRERQLRPVSELLRREGVGFGGEDSPTIQLPSKVNAANLLERDTDQQETATKRRTGRIASISSAAVLCGLTIAGLIALKPTIGTTPDSHAGGAGQSPDYVPPAQSDGMKPTTSVLKRSNNTSETGGGSSTATQRPAAEGGNASSGSGSASGSSGQAPSTTTTPPPSTTSAPKPTTPPSSEQAPPKDSEDSDGGNDDGDDNDGGLLSSVTKTADDTLDPVTGSISGSLGSLLGE
ncbi:MAG: hypothetical protein GEU86_00780 [Actinophytocola sp.]|nr:hypothetical protein [Actinophytocola sp.]